MTKRLVFAIQSRLERGEDGVVRTSAGYARYEAWTGYLQVFDQVTIVARVKSVQNSVGHVVEGPGVDVLSAPYYRGLSGMVRTMPEIVRFYLQEVNDRGAFYGGRVPNLLGVLLQLRARSLSAPFLAQLVGDPSEVLKAGVAGRIGKVLAPISGAMLRWSAKHAGAVIYVTQESLQRLYPPSPSALVLSRSNVELPSRSIAIMPRNYVSNPPRKDLKVATAGTQEQNYKGHDTLIRACGMLVREGFSISATIIGGGRLHEQLVDLAAKQGVSDVVHFTGSLASADDVRIRVKDCDLFVLPSRTEGLPRVLIEAMASGVLSIGSRVGGIPELLEDRWLFDSDDPSALATAIKTSVKDHQAMTEGASEQWLKARTIATEYSGDAILGGFLAKWTSGRRTSL